MIQRRIENDGIVSIHSPYYVTFFFCNVFLNVPYLFLVFMWIRIKLILERINFAIKREKKYRILPWPELYPVERRPSSRWASRVALVVKVLTCQCRRCGFDSWVGKIPGEGTGNPFQYSCLENSMDGGPYRTTLQSRGCKVRRD